MRPPIHLKTKTPSPAAVLQITCSVALIFVFAILLASARVATPILGNYPDTSLPLSTDTTVTPDAPPSNTVSINVSTSTDFQGTLAGDPNTGVVRVTDAHPAGTYTVTVTAFDSVGGTATRTFTLTVATPVTCTRVSFAAAAYFAANSGPYSVAVGDFNGDGKQDLATANNFSNNVSILLGDGTGHFSAPTNFAANSGPYSVAVGDFNGDGKQDVAVANSGSNNVSILLGDGTGNFSAPTNFTAGSGPRSVAVGDFNRDGKQDLAVANSGSNIVSILLGDGRGHFSGPTNFTVGSGPYSVAVGDFNGDGKQDLATANYNSNNVSILLGDGTGHFSGPTNFAAGSGSWSVAVGDFNGDGKQDLATVNYLAGPVSLSILLGDGTGNFSAPTDFAAKNGPYSVAVGDFNGDGNQDLAIAADTAWILLGDGTGNFRTAMNFAGGDYPVSVAVGDFNGDGKQDIAVAHTGITPGVSTLLRDCPVSQITPTGTTCSQFSSGTAETLGSVQYDLNSDVIHRVTPRNFLYWVPVTAPAGDNIFEITQTITTGNFDTLFALVGDGSNVLDSDCVSLQSLGRQSGNTVTVMFNAPTAGTYYIAIKFNSQSLIGQPAPGSDPGSVQYHFMTTGVPASTSILPLVKY